MGQDQKPLRLRRPQKERRNFAAACELNPHFIVV
jgi:hypothetical protein